MRLGIDQTGAPVHLPLRFVNRHGIVAGATGTGKTVTLLALTESLARAGVPVFIADMKGDVSGLASANRAAFWCLHGERGRQLRVSIQSMGAPMLSRVLGLSPAQSGVLDVVFRVASDRALPLATLDDLRHALDVADRERSQVSRQYGQVASQSLASIKRSILTLEDDGGRLFFGPDNFSVDALVSDPGLITILAAESLAMRPRIYSTFLLWMLSSLFDSLPEVGNPDRPVLAFIFDEAHLLFQDADTQLLRRIEQTVRLIRSKGVGVFFSSQSPADIPDAILAQLGNRVQHALRAYTPKDARAVRIAASTFPPAPDIDPAAMIGTLPTGCALVSVMGPGGVPSPVRAVNIALPACRLGPATEAERAAATPADDYSMPAPCQQQQQQQQQPQPAHEPDGDYGQTLRAFIMSG